MGDITSVELSTLICFEKLANPIVSEDPPNDESANETFKFWFFDEVNYGTPDCLTELQKAGIPYDSAWGDGSEYGPGVSYCRFNALGELVVKDVSDSSINPQIHKLMELIDHPAELRNFIVDHQAKYATPSWDNQEEYSKLYRTKQLLTSG